MTLADARIEYRLVLEARGVAESTLAKIEYHLDRFARYVMSEAGATPALDDEATIRLQLLHYLRDAGADLAPSTFNSALSVLRAFFNWALQEGFIHTNLLRGTRKKTEDDWPHSIDERALRQLLMAPDNSTLVGKRDRALFALQVDTGIRPGEAFRLVVDDLDLANSRVVIPAPAAKTRKSRVLPISRAVVELVTDLISAREPHWLRTVPVFCSKTGKPLNRHMWAQRLQHYSRRIGVRITPYSLRHAFAVCFLRGGGNAFALQRMLGHSTLAMTRRYVALTQDDLNAVHASASPVARLLRLDK